MIVVSDNYIKDPVVSVRIITYNQEKTISQTIESVLNQNCTYPFEIVIGEDCSTDKTRSICVDYQKKYPQKIKLLLQEKNKGLVPNWIDVNSLTKGKYLAGLAGDDYWHNPDKLQISIDYLERNRDTGIVYTDFDKLYQSSGKRIKNVNARLKGVEFESDNQIKSIIERKLWIVPLTSCLVKELYDKYIPVKDYLKYNFPIEDLPTWLLLSKHTKIGYIPVSTGTRRVGHESLSNPLTYEKIEDGIASRLQMRKRLSEILPDDFVYDEQKVINYNYNKLLQLAFRKRDFISARKFGKILLDNDYKSAKVRFSQNLMMFKSYVYLRGIRNFLLYSSTRT